MVYWLTFFASLSGVAAHQTYRFTRALANGWSNLTDHSIGAVIIAPFLLLFFIALDDENDTDPRLVRRVFLAYVLSCVGIGAGVAAGWMADRFSPRP